MPIENYKIEMSFDETDEKSDGELANRFVMLLEISKNFFASMGLHENLMLEIFQARTDWEFILKIDALLESATKEIVKSSLKLKVLDHFVGEDALANFVDSLPVNGRTSVLQLLRASGCPDEDCDFVESVRLVRNAYAHNIKFADVFLIELIKTRGDRSKIIKVLCNIKNYEEKSLIASYEQDGGFLRFGIVDATMRILIYAYHLSSKNEPQDK